MSYDGWMHKSRPISGDLNHPPRWRRFGDTARQISRKVNILETAGLRGSGYGSILVPLVEANNEAPILQPRRTHRFEVRNYFIFQGSTGLWKWTKIGLYQSIGNRVKRVLDP
ncbi:unnamed protein product [Lasius platythorax]|uniref:Uncharacterized protein n=1 Tax=Lasius platythorax TaxID=488582 RepID=A0AAV2MXY0_9HYME